MHVCYIVIWIRILSFVHPDFPSIIPSTTLLSYQVPGIVNNEIRSQEK